MKTHLWSTQPFLKLRYPRKWGCRGDLQDSFRKKLRKNCVSTKCGWLWAQRSICMYTNCIKQFQTKLYHDWRKLKSPAWNSTFFGFPKPATLAKIITPEDWAPTAWSNYHTPKKSNERFCWWTFIAFFIPLQEIHPPCQTSGSLPTLSLYKSLIYFSQK